MRWSNFVLLMLGISMCLYFVGYTSLANAGYMGSDFDTWRTGNGTSTDPAPQAIDNSNMLMLYGLLFGAVMAVAWVGQGTLGSPFSVTYLIPLSLLSAGIAYFVLPLSFIFDGSLPLEVKVIGGMVLNTLMLLAIFSFIKGDN